ncbi:RNA-directed DNA polymerase, eukaryota, reverse transcriptase zinc-binding domain protein [Tanacetum coccineum]
MVSSSGSLQVSENPRTGGPHVGLLAEVIQNFSEQVSNGWEVSNDEIKKSFGTCGTDKAPGPDGFTVGFFRTLFGILWIGMFLKRDVGGLVNLYAHVHADMRFFIVEWNAKVKSLHFFPVLDCFHKVSGFKKSICAKAKSWALKLIKILAMGDSEWREVTRRKRRLVFDRLGNHSNKTDTWKIHGKNTIAVYVSNFPSHLTVRELWNICGKKGNIVDVYIAKHKNKLGQMFGFCRFNGIDNNETLIDSLNEVWIGRLRLHANIARFDRKEGPKPYQADEKRHDSHVLMKRDMILIEHNGGKQDSDREHVGESPEILLSQEGNSRLALALIGCFKDFRSIANSKIICKNESFQGVETKYLGGLWVLFEFDDKEVRDKFLIHEGTLSWWDEVLFIDDIDNTSRFSIRLCIKSSHASLIFASIVVMFKGVSYAIRVRELCSWTPNFGLDDSDDEEEGSVGTHKNNDERDSLADSENESVRDISINENDVDQQNREDEQLDANATSDKTEEGELKHDLSDVSTPLVHEEGSEALKQHEVFSIQSSQTKDNEMPKKYVGISIIKQMEDTINVGMALGYNMEGCQDTLTKIIADMSDEIETKMVCVDMWTLRQVWWNSQFDFASISSRGCWVLNGLDIMFIAVYAPQSVTGKIELWASLSRLITNWVGNVIVMGDFNEVREAGERYGSVFHERQSDVFNFFIENLNLIDIPLGVHDSFPHIIGTVLEKGVPDHRPILIKEFVVDYGPTPFCFFHSWLNVEAIRTWNASKKLNDNHLRKEHQSMLSLIDTKVDQGDAKFDSELPISLIGCQYKIIGKLLANRISKYRKRKKELMVFKVDFEKAYDSLRWDYLDVIMENLGFGYKWRTWISGCLKNSQASILVNGSPTAEFEIFKGLLMRL